MIRATFQLIPGLGAGRERALWTAGVRDWADIRSASPRELPIPEALLSQLLAALDAVEEAWEDKDLPALGKLIPQGEHWRLFGAFGEKAVYLDIEIDGEEGVTVVGTLGGEGPKLMMAGRSLDAASLSLHVPSNCLLVTFNGSSFDVPKLCKHFGQWQPPAAHLDLRHTWNKLGHWGGLKALEDEMGIGRPLHIRDLDGSAACWLWRHWRLGDKTALVKLVEYNLYDAVNLRTLAAMAFNRMLDKYGFSDQSVAVSHRGDVLYDVSRILLSL